MSSSSVGHATAVICDNPASIQRENCKRLCLSSSQPQAQLADHRYTHTITDTRTTKSTSEKDSLFECSNGRICDETCHVSSESTDLSCATVRRKSLQKDDP